MALKADDELFHTVLYDWLLDMDLTDKLLEVNRMQLTFAL